MADVFKFWMYGARQGEVLCAHGSQHTGIAHWDSMKKDVGGRFGGDVMVGSAPSQRWRSRLRDLYERGCIDDPKLGDFEGFWYFAEGLDKKF